MNQPGVVLASDSSSSSDDDSDRSIRGSVEAARSSFVNSAGNPAANATSSPFQTDYGIGATLMASMGYKPGKGLGATESGRAEPIQQIGTQGKRGLGAIPQEWSDDESLPETRASPRVPRAPKPSTSDAPSAETLRQEKLQTIYKRSQAELHKITSELDVVQRLARTLAAAPAGALDLPELYAEFGDVWDQLNLQDLAISVISAWLQDSAADDVPVLLKINECRYMLGEDDLRALLRAYWLPKIEAACTPWTEESSVWLGNVMLDLKDAPDLQTLVADDLDNLLVSLAVKSGEFDSGFIAYMDEWWPDSSAPVDKVVAILERGFDPELITKPSLDSWYQLHPELAAALDRIIRAQVQTDFENGEDVYARWALLGDSLDTIMDSIWANKLVSLSLDHPNQLVPQLEQWHEWAVAKRQQNTRILDGINVALDGNVPDGTVEGVWEAVDNAGKVVHEAVRATFKDVVEQQCQNAGLFLVRQPTALKEHQYYWLSRAPEPTPTAVSCYMADDVLYVQSPDKASQSFEPISVRELDTLSI